MPTEEEKILGRIVQMSADEVAKDKFEQDAKNFELNKRNILRLACDEISSQMPKHYMCGSPKPYNKRCGEYGRYYYGLEFPEDKYFNLFWDPRFNLYTTILPCPGNASDKLNLEASLDRYRDHLAKWVKGHEHRVAAEKEWQSSVKETQEKERKQKRFELYYKAFWVVISCIVIYDCTS